MKTYQLDIEDNLFPEFKRILNMFPPNSVKLYSKNGYEIQLDTDDLDLTDEFKRAIEEVIAELDRARVLLMRMLCMNYRQNTLSEILKNRKDHLVA